MTTARAFPRRCARMYSSRSCALTMRAIRTRAAQVSAWRSPATSRAHMAAISRSAIHRLADCGRPSACRCDPRLLALHVGGGASENLHQMRFGLGVAFEPFADSLAQMIEGRLGKRRQIPAVAPLAARVALPLADAFADRRKAGKHDVDQLAVGRKIGAAFVGDGVELLRSEERRVGKE